MFDQFSAAAQSPRIHAEVATPLGHALAVTIDQPQADRHLVIRERSYWIDLCLTPPRLQASGRYCDVWTPDRRQALGALIALRSAYCCRLRLRERMSGRYSRRPRTVST